MLQNLDSRETARVPHAVPATVVDDFYFLLSTSPDGRFTFAGRVEWQHRGRTTLMLFDGRTFVRQWHWSERLLPGTSSWSDDSTLFAFGRGFRIHVFDVARDQQRTINVQNGTRGVFFGPGHELIVRAGADVLVYDPNGIVPKLRTPAVQFSFSGRHFVYCDRKGSLRFSSGLVRHLPDLADRLSTAPLRQMLVSPLGEGASVVSWPKSRDEHRANVIAIPATPDGEILHGNIELPRRHDAEWTGWTAGSLLAIEPTEGGVRVARHDIRDGTRHELGSIDCVHADFIGGYDRSFYVSADSLPGKPGTLMRVGVEGVKDIVHIHNEYATLQVGRPGIRAMISASPQARWQLRIDGEVVETPLARAGDSEARRGSPMAHAGFGHGVIATPKNGAAIIYIPGLFSPDRAFGQTPFFQHVLYCVTRALYREGFSYCVLRSLRDAPRDYSLIAPEITARVREAMAALRAQGCTRVGILGGSIAGYALLRDVTVANECSAMMMLSPVHFMSQTTAARLGYDRADPVVDVPRTVAARAAALSTPIAIVHGVQDELSPAYHSSLFMASVRESVPRRYVPIEDEGHVFSTFESWQRAVEIFLDFAREHLNPAGRSDA